MWYYANNQATKLSIKMPNPSVSTVWQMPVATCLKGLPAVMSEAVRVGKSKLRVLRLNKCQFPEFLLYIQRHSSG